jgi:hypothetical protein
VSRARASALGQGLRTVFSVRGTHLSREDEVTNDCYESFRIVRKPAEYAIRLLDGHNMMVDELSKYRTQITGLAYATDFHGFPNQNCESIPAELVFAARGSRYLHTMKFHNVLGEVARGSERLPLSTRKSTLFQR